MTAIIAGKLPASFIPVEFSLAPPRRPSTASSLSTTSSSRSTRTHDLVRCLEPSYRYLLRPGNGGTSTPLSASTASTSFSTLLGTGTQVSTTANTSEQGSMAESGCQNRKVRRKGLAYRSPPWESAQPQDLTTTSPSSGTSSDGPSSSTTAQSLAGIVNEPLAYVGTINYGFILNACQMLAQPSDGSSNRSPPRNGESSSQRHSSSAKSNKGKSGGAKGSAGIWDWKGKGNDRSAKEPMKQKKMGANGSTTSSRINNGREANEDSRSRSKRPARNASQQRQQRNQSSEPASASKKTSPPAANGTHSSKNNSAAGSGQPASDGSGAKQSSSLVPPPSVHAVHAHPPPSPLRQSAIPARLSDKSHKGKGKAVEILAAETPMTRSTSHGGASDAVIHATRGTKRRQSSAGPSFAAGEDEDDVSKRLRRALASSIPLAGPALAESGSSKRPTRTTRPGTRYATRSAPNSPPEAPSDSFEEGAVDQSRLHPAVSRVGRALRRTLSHDALPEETGSLSASGDAEAVAQSRRRRDVSLPKNLRDYQTGIHA